MDIINEIKNGKQILILRDPIPKGKLGISFVFDDDKRFNGKLDMTKHKNLILAITKAFQEEEE
jgi:phosphoribosylformylglycinamidine (FGAM) synthase-like amidotransferase family enzyme